MLMYGKKSFPCALSLDYYIFSFYFMAHSLGNIILSFDSWITSLQAQISHTNQLHSVLVHSFQLFLSSELANY